MNILVFGDSIAYGLYDKEGGWADRLKRHLVNEYHRLFNLSIPGERVSGLFKRISTEARPRIKVGVRNVGIIEVGINDAAIEGGRPRSSEEAFREDFKQLLQVASKIFDSTIVLGLTRVDEKRTTPVGWKDALFYVNERIDRFDRIVEEVSGTMGALYVPLHSLLDPSDLYDGLHPDTSGHIKIFRKVLNILSKELNTP